MKTYFQILLGALPIALLVFIFISTKDIKEEQGRLKLGKSISHAHYNLVSKATNPTQFDRETLKRVKTNLNRTYEELGLKFLINTQVDSSQADAILIVSQSKFKLIPNEKEQVHIATLANGKLSYLSREQYNKLDLTQFDYIDQFKASDQ
ncbi:hypothetical protein LNTAR_06564 [Lentisphaera araneosa HTCC2155]|jgi:hypothetical protein|uniref:Uncharacterized protein n=1 Tax=Lentisphaera araneosa HTCC2155 TaxID=313628 RepID=A6DND9_9BACT|nr:hypothetical protein [Lentisphaera araneosa]EDM26887.1 hypothetical protein LNTAR_06564 [Lentisphaera araneosa HTCC2155]